MQIKMQGDKFEIFIFKLLIGRGIKNDITAIKVYSHGR